MFERFTDRARRVMTLANQEAQRLGHDHIGTEHLLLGLVKEVSGVAAVVLREFKVDLSSARQQVERAVHGPNRDVSSHPVLQQTPRLQRVLQFAVQEAQELGQNYVGTEHLLLGLLREPEGTAAKVLSGLHLQLEQVREAVLRQFGRLPRSATADKQALLEQAMTDLTPMLAEESVQSQMVRAVVEGLINAGWRPRE